METANNETGCCPRFDPAPWDDQQFEWSAKPFIKAKVCTLFYMPLNFGSVMKKLNAKVEQSNATMPQWLCLSEHTSKWNMDVYLAVDREVANIENVTLSGRYYSKVYEGSFKNVDKWCSDFEKITKDKGFKTGKTYLWYTTCPKCAKVYGKNYVVIVSELVS